MPEATERPESSSLIAASQLVDQRPNRARTQFDRCCDLGVILLRRDYRASFATPSFGAPGLDEEFFPTSPYDQSRDTAPIG
jgi:hypothetical protein